MSVRKGLVDEIGFKALCKRLEEMEVLDALEAIAVKHGGTFKDVVGPRKFQHLNDARFESIVLLHTRFPRMSRKHVGHFVGSDHAMVTRVLQRAGVIPPRTPRGVRPRDSEPPESFTSESFTSTIDNEKTS